MSEEGEKSCPLCAEEMDLTDQQLKPCKCGYEICVWCWHHIMDMAEKDDTDGRCPACRSPYDKEKIVGMAANCGRLVAEVSMERKMKVHKAKSKSTEGRKQLSSVRVIQRNLAYIVGLPLNLADEDLLQRREYFGQYGKVLKVSMSRTAAGVIQQFPNNTCSVYITYSKEDEAIRCIQNVHGFVLDGRPLRACFGTTKYCHAWLRNVPCSNPDCLYLHEIGCQEDCFTKDEIISAYTRSRVQQITGAGNSIQQRSGNVLPPPPVDDYSNTSGKPIVKNNTSYTTSMVKGSPPPNGTTGRYISLPPAAAWGTRAINCQPPAAGVVRPNGPSKQKPDTVSSTLAFSSAVAGITQAATLHGDTLKKSPSNEESSSHPKGKIELLKSLKHGSVDGQAYTSEKPATSEGSSAPVILNKQSFSPLSSKYSSRGNSTDSIDLNRQSGSVVPEQGIAAKSDEIQNLCVDLSSIDIDRSVRNEHYILNTPSSLPTDHVLHESNGVQGIKQYLADKSRETLIPGASGKADLSVLVGCPIREHCDERFESQAPVGPSTSTVAEEDIISFDNQRLKDPEVIHSSPFLRRSENLLPALNHSRTHPLHSDGLYNAMNIRTGSLSVDDNVGDNSFLHASGMVHSGYLEKMATGSSTGLNKNLEQSFLLQDDWKGKQNGRLHCDIGGPGTANPSLDKGENNIISNILSLDWDTWDESLTSPESLAKLLGDADKTSSSLKISSSCKGQINNQSRFSFARQEESINQAFGLHQSFNVSEQLQSGPSFFHHTAERDMYADQIGIGNSLSSSNFKELGNFGNCHSIVSPNKLSAVSRAQISAPPGFSVPSRPPPPGFSSHEGVNHAGNSLIEATSLMRNSYQIPSIGNVSVSRDIEFMDPAILAVGKGRLKDALHSPSLDMRSNFSPQLNSFENEARIQALMQRSLQPYQNLRFSDVGNSFSHLGDSYGIPSRHVDQSQKSNISPLTQLSLQSRNSILSNGPWEGWNEVQGRSSLDVAELLRNERVGYNKFYNSYEESKYQMPNAGDFYNRTYGI